MSALEKTLLFQIKAMGLALPEKEYRFHETRRWRFDFAYPEQQLAVEVEGGTWAGGRHTRGSGYEKDCEKYNAAALRGWSVLRFTGSMIKSGKAVETLKEALS
ncbi:endonuclease domain-containing protein [Vibrio alginolyticus]|uniref:endonuclease domain-containing protein n=1 Tax=Vibrio TaxID=662 RepID=UPI001EEADB44|nr:endonuclease domain-containing protein [Vibrio sp. 1288]MCG6308971.1 endonuclease domain-containing protein [Vibrio alginolyticus]MDW3133754.1 endonuclease domain-containing protein [Vibrio sp. 1288]